MNSARYDVVGIGNAIVDVLTQADEVFLETALLPKGSMTLISEQRALELYAGMAQTVDRSGGSAANTLAGLASLGGVGAYIGKVKNDTLGEVFADDLRAAGLAFDTVPLVEGPATARCLIFVTPDAQRTMGTYLGACVHLNTADIDPKIIRDSQVTYLEGYLFDPPEAKQAFRAAAQVAHGAGRKVSLTLSDPFCVERHREEFLELVQHHVDVLFANEREILALGEFSSFEQAAAWVAEHCEIAALTRSEKGSVVIGAGDVIEIHAEPVAQVVDTTGAGDLYAAGFLYGYTRQRPMGECARYGALAAAEVISHFGARPECDLKTWVADKPV